MRIGIVNDLPLAVAALRRVLRYRPRHEIAWTAGNGVEALAHCREDPPDLILMDLLMPVMSGVEATRKIMAETPCPILVVTCSITGNVAKVFEAMGAGALDAVDTPSYDASESSPLLAKVDLLERYLAPRDLPRPRASAAILPRPAARSQPRLVAIGASAGGPSAVAGLLKLLPRRFPAALVVIQHVEERFAPSLARWLGSQSALPVRVAQEGCEPVSGEVLVAAKGGHLVFTGPCQLGYRMEPEGAFYRPSIDVFFQSLMRHWKGEAAGVLLTGMGSDGAEGLLQLRRAGCYTVAQNEESSAVYGMPKAAARLGAAADILALEKIAEALQRWCSRTFQRPENNG